MISHGYTSQLFNMIIFSPLIKNKRASLQDSNNYRAISLDSCFGKLLDYVVMEFFNDVLLSDNHQFAYKAGHSTTLCSFIVMETIQYYRQRNSNVILTMLDCSKAFDRVKYDRLFPMLLDRGMRPVTVRLILIMYLSIEAKVKWRGFYSSSFKVFNDVKQGGVLTPILF